MADKRLRWGKIHNSLIRSFISGPRFLLMVLGNSFLSPLALASRRSFVAAGLSFLTCAGASAQLLPNVLPNAPTGNAKVELREVRGGEALEVIERMARAARELPYQGVFVHQTADEASTSRVTHIVDRQGVEHEKIEALDGPMSEIIRRNDEMFCYHPDAKVVRVDRRASGRFFPALITGSAQAVAENYRVKLGAQDRIAGFDCQWVVLEPKDALRYMHKLCAELGTGLLLRAHTYNERRQLLEQFMFTQLDVSRSVSKQAVKSQFEQAPGWQRDNSVKTTQKDTETGWIVNGLPSGFKKVMEIVRSFTGKPQPVAHLVFSDGLSNVSVFVEPSPTPGRVSAGGASDGNPTTFAVRTVTDSQVTVVGDVPFTAVQAIADGVTRQIR
jgi:sigma-E factor negative regulatory protein RseB